MNTRIIACPLPDDALLRHYERAGGFTDCYCTQAPGAIPLSRFITAFYSTPLFRTEAAILAIAARAPSTRAEAQALGQGETERFAVWTTEARTDDQLLMCDARGATRSWFHVSPAPGNATCLWFGSAVVGKPDARTGQTRMGWPFRALLGFHALYSRALLGAARRRLQH